jgi:hypothetical protein
MGHLPTPCHPLHEPIEVSFVCNKLGEYDGGLLDTYPVGKGRANLTDQTPHLQSIVQTWLSLTFLLPFSAKGPE